jgi:hypothetical protein
MFYSARNQLRGRDCTVVIATQLEGPVLELRRGQDISLLNFPPDQTRNQNSLLYNRYRAVNCPGRGVDHPPPPSAKVDNG